MPTQNVALVTAASCGMGVASVVWGVTLPDDGPTGGFFRGGQRVKW